MPPTQKSAIDPFLLIGETTATPRSYEYLSAEARLRNAPSPETPPTTLSTSAAVARVKQEKLRGFAAVGRLATLAGITLVDAEVRIRDEDETTIRAARGTFRMRDVPTFFAQVSASTRAASEFSEEQRRAIAMRATDADGRGNVRR